MSLARIATAGGLVFSILFGGSEAAEVDSMLPSYRPASVQFQTDAQYVTASGAVAIVGYNDMRDMLEALCALYQKAHPETKFVLDLKSTRSAPTALAAGTSAFAPMGAEFTPQQLADYRAATGADPVPVRIAHASLDPSSLTGPLAILVNKDNPLSSLTFDQIGRAFSGEAKRWGDLGLTGEWTDRPIHLYGVEVERPLALELQTMAFPERRYAPELTGFRLSAQAVEKVSADRSGLGFAAAIRMTPAVRALAIAPRPGDTPVELTRENIMQGRYPLDRYVLIYFRPPINSVAREFLRLVMSRDGQQAIAAGPLGYLPLSEKEAATERAKLN